MSIQVNSPEMKSGWTVVKFGDVVKNANLGERDPEAAGIERVVGLEHLEPENLHVRRWNTLENDTSFTRKFVPGQTLFGKRRAYQRKVAFAEFEGICSGDILTFEPKDPNVLLPELLPFICQTDAFFDHALGTSAGSLSPRTSYKALQNFEFPLPPIEEQKRIAEILWAADEAVDAHKQVQRKGERLLAVTLFQRLSESSNSIRKLGSFAKIRHGFAFKSKFFSDADEMPLLLTPGNFTLDGKLSFSEKNTKRYSGEYPHDFVLSRNDIVVVMTDLTPSAKLLGMPAFVENDMILHNQRIGKLIFDDSVILPGFLYFSLLNDGFRRQIRRSASGTTVKHTSPDRLLSSNVSVPSMKKQENLLEEFRRLRLSIRATQTNIDSLKHTSLMIRESSVARKSHV